MAVTRAKKIEQGEKLGGELKKALEPDRGHLLQADGDAGLRVAQGIASDRGEASRGEEHFGRARRQGHQVEEALKNLQGVTSIAYTEGDPVALAKALAKYAKDHPEFSFKAGVVEGRVITVKEIESLATMPSKEELYSKLLFLLNAPSQRLVTAMNAVGRNLAVVVSQGVEQKKFKEA